MKRNTSDRMQSMEKLDILLDIQFKGCIINFVVSEKTVTEGENRFVTSSHFEVGLIRKVPKGWDDEVQTPDESQALP